MIIINDIVTINGVKYSLEVLQEHVNTAKEKSEQNVFHADTVQGLINKIIEQQELIKKVNKILCSYNEDSLG